jgi:hypothetical protein
VDELEELVNLKESVVLGEDDLEVDTHALGRGARVFGLQQLEFLGRSEKGNHDPGFHAVQSYPVDVRAGSMELERRSSLESWSRPLRRIAISLP